MPSSISHNREGANFAPMAAPVGAALGINTKSSPPPPTPAQQTRGLRFKILHQLRSILAAEAVAGGRQPYDYHRTAKCQHCRIDSAVQIRQRERAYYNGVAVCGSVWTCPVCCARVQARRREEIRRVVDHCYASGQETQFVTLTFPHTRGEPLAVLLAKQSAALKMFRQGAPWQRFKAATGFAGLVRTREITHGAHGWHPHTHELWITAVLDDAQRERVLATVQERWVRCLVKAGFEFRRGGQSRAVDVVWRAKTADYLAKADSLSWGVEAEMTQALHKGGKAGGRTPFEIVADWGNYHRKGDARLVVEYIDATKGKAQLFFSKGVKAAAGLDEITDEQIAAAASVDDQHVLFIAPSEWDAVVSARKQAELLDAAEAGGPEAALVCLLDCSQAAKLASGGGVVSADDDAQHVLNGQTVRFGGNDQIQRGSAVNQ